MEDANGPELAKNFVEIADRKKADADKRKNDNERQNPPKETHFMGFSN